MGDSIAHRGPDAEGFAFIDHANFAHRRLAILDLENGRQPMFDTSRRCCIVFNGEIYNFRELRQQLADGGAVFKTQSDTEVILQLYLFEGIAGFSKLRGMYAFALWDAQTQSGFLVRDPLGIKPLFYQRGKTGELVFASEAKAILARDNATGCLDEAQLHSVMNFRYITGNGSLIRNVSQLAPGTIMRWRVDGSTTTTSIAGPNDAGLAGEQESVLESLRASVLRHLVSDVEVGAYLSGGVDSATIVALANNLNPGSVRTFTVQAGDDPMEAEHAARTAQLLSVENLQQTLAIDARKELAQLIWHLEVPKVNSLQVLKVAQHASQHVKVALSGVGSDELFLGYNLYSIARTIHLASGIVPSGLLNAGGTAAQMAIDTFSHIPWSEPWRLTEIIKQLPNWPRVYALIRNVWDTPDMRRTIYGPRMLDQSLPNPYLWLEEQWPKNPDPILAIREFEWRHKMVNDLLWQEDRCSMAMGLEVRVPFVDQDLKGALWRLDRKTLMPKGQKKGLLKQSIASLLPVEILNRPKSGFQVDAAAFFESQLSSLADEFLSREYTETVGLFNPDFIARVRGLPQAKATRWHYFMLYLMLGVHLWVEIYERGNRSLS
jgi:asparagine synthase (glutamine-hydrolysing)